MNLICHLFLSHLPSVMTETRFIDGKEQVCLVLPVKENQIKKGRDGSWLMMFRLKECPPNEKMITHDVQLMYLTAEEVQRSYELGYHYRTEKMGRVRVHDRTPEKKIDRTNRASDIVCDGRIILTDIPKRLIVRNELNDKRYLPGLTFRSNTDNGCIFTGTLCVDDIPYHHIKTDQCTGKKYVDARFKKLERLDTYMNTHQLIVTTGDGTELEIGRFKEWRKDGYAAAENEQHTTTISPRPQPDSINGIKF